MSINKTPGVYVQEIAKLPPSVAEVETAIPAFIGLTKTNSPAAGANPVVRRIRSLLEYEQFFGGPDLSSTIQVTIIDTATPGPNSTIANRVFSTSTVYSEPSLYYHMQMFFANGGGACYIVSIGSYSTTITPANVKAGIKELARYDEPTLICMPEAAEQLTIAEYGDVVADALALCANLKDRFVIADVATDDATTASLTSYRSGLGQNNLKYGAAYYPFVNSNLQLAFDPANVTIAHTPIPGVSALPNSFNSLTQPMKDAVMGVLAKITVPELAPSSAIAGIYATVDNERGVWKAPANVSINSVSSLTENVDDATQDGMNVDANTGKSINAIRAFMGKGIIVWGARTLAGNDNEWRYVPVRRFFNFVEESCMKSTGWAVFEPNDANTWLRVKGQIENFLNNLWTRGALAGAKPEHAYYVSIGLGQTMTAQDILEGRMIVEIGMAAVRPAEFIILRFSHMLQQS